NDKFYRVYNTEIEKELLSFRPIVKLLKDFDNRGSTVIVKEHTPKAYLDNRIQELQTSHQIKEMDWPTNVNGIEDIYRITNKGKEVYELDYSFLEKIGSLDSIQLNLDPDNKGALALLSSQMEGDPTDNWPVWGHELLNNKTFKLIGAIKSTQKRRIVS
ncbi:MAG: hypothetical protein RL709_313, partial [Pseudomonadota bacterium]